MAYTLNIEITVKQKKNCKSFYFTDSTPLFDPVTAPNGYDPNYSTGFDPGDIDTDNVFVDITKPDGTVINIPITSADIIEANIGATGLVNIEVTAEDISEVGEIPDGVYLFKYTVFDNNGNSYTASCYVVADCQVCCCLDTKLKNLKSCKNCPPGSTSKSIDDLYAVWMLKFKAREQAACGDFTGAQETLDLLTQYCDIKKCDSCNN